MTAIVRVLTVSAVDSSPSLLLVSPNGSKILVNCGEGCQRAFLEFSQRLSTVKAICLTHLGHAATGGLPGAILTLADIPSKGVTPVAKERDTTVVRSGSGSSRSMCIVGPKGTRQFAHSLRHFMARPSFHLDIHEADVEGLKVRRQDGNYPNTQNQPKSLRAVNLADQLDFSIETLTVSEERQEDCVETRKRSRPFQREIVSYLFKTPPIPGAFQRDKATLLGIPPGPLYSRLKAGETVTFTHADGSEKSVASSQVVSPSSPSIAVQVLHYDTEDMANELFKKATERIRDVHLEVVVHIAPPELFHRVGLPYWKEQAENIFLSTERKGASPFVSSILGGSARALLSSDIYSKPLTVPKRSEVPLGFRFGDPMLDYVLIPRARRGFGNAEAFERLAKDDSLLVATECGALSAAQKIMADKVNVVESETKEGAILFTGTGSAVPCKHRNVSGIYLKQANGKGVLLDAGEGTIGQLLRMGEGGDHLSQISAAIISHPHADHHLGLIRLLEDREADDPVHVVAPDSVFRFLEEYAVIQPGIVGKYSGIVNSELVRCVGNDRPLYESLGIRVRTLPVTHCPEAYGVILDATSFGRIVYSGDCRPSQKLALAGRGADVLIHEATFEDGMEAEAALKKHSTIGEALSIAKAMQAKTVVLTHFSQRYPKFPHVDRERGASTIIAFDYLRLRRSQLSVAPLFNPALRLLYPEELHKDKEQDSQSQAVSQLSVPGFFATAALCNKGATEKAS